MSGIIQNRIIYSSGNDFIEFTAILPANSSILQINSSMIKIDNTIDVFTNIYGVNPRTIIHNAGQLILKFNPQVSDMNVKVRIS